MNIALDAKRAFHNTTGLGNYSRNLIEGLATYYPNNNYILYNTKPSNLFQYKKYTCIKEILPKSFFAKKFNALWRSVGISTQLKKKGIQLYHGLSNELPFGISEKIPTIVSIHDLIFERYPQQYHCMDVHIYRKKYQYACKRATKIIAISEQTKKDLVNIYGIDENKIIVSYQSCHTKFSHQISPLKHQRVKQKYHLPNKYFLNVGSIIERKNLLTICKAIYILKDKLNIPLVVIGNGNGKYYKEVKQYITNKKLSDKIIFLNNRCDIHTITHEDYDNDLPAIYQQAEALIYPSIFEGWGIPIMEAFLSHIPVITNNASSLLEVGGKAVYYVNPFDEEAMAEAMQELAENKILRKEYIEKGIAQASLFSQKNISKQLINIYHNLCH